MKSYFQKFNEILKENRFSYFFLLFIGVVIFNWAYQGYIKYFLIFLFVLSLLSFAVQSVILLKKNIYLYTFRIFLIILLCFEVVFGFLNSNDKSSITGYYDYVVSDSVLGWRFKPNCDQVRSTKIYNDDTVYDVYYSSDKYSRRKQYSFDELNPNFLSDKKKHAIFLGCSFTFGQGLNYESTFPYLFERENPDYKSYNYGFSNYAPHEFCFFFDKGVNIVNNVSVPQDSGFCMYSYIDDHLNRVFGSSDYLSNANTKDSPEVFIKNNKLILKKRSCVKKMTSWFLNNSETLKYFGIKTTYPKNDEFYRRFADIVNYTACKYWELKPFGDFYVSLYPNKYCVIDTSWIKFLDKKIILLKTNSPKDFDSNKSYLIKNDGHPNKQLNLYYAQEITKSIIKK